MESRAGRSSAVWSKLGMQVPYASRLVAGAWVVAGWAGLAYGVYLTVIAMSRPPGTGLTGHWILQPPFKASMAVLLALAAVAHPIARERRWLVPALLFSAAGDWLLAIPWWTQSFVFGLGSFLLAHLCFLGAMLPLALGRVPSRARLVPVVLMCVGAISLLVWFWPHLGQEKLTVPVTVYILALTAMVCTAFLARLPTIWTAVGALSFAVSDSMIAISRFILGNEALAVPIWWSYAAAEILITAGFFFGREIPAGAAEPTDR
ncbi:putative membrane protein [Mycobacterium pseudokansasii]|nr:putative membrane protein [Mycobacterium pseudokansasii]VAZ95085.1 putative membrane protein [Mycobacterium pseudokansasii]